MNRTRQLATQLKRVLRERDDGGDQLLARIQRMMSVS